jgi:hypothetical protein
MYIQVSLNYVINGSGASGRRCGSKGSNEHRSGSASLKKFKSA